ncbi:MAG: hypothetical protein WDZ35_02445 [Crocinitomicaceae bacterium]
MRPIYFILRITLPYAFAVFFRQRRSVNAQKKFKAQTIFVSNHPSAFLDPPVAANFQHSIIFFMTRSDVFKSWLKPITWSCHMVPIYRADKDGGDTYNKNQNVFRGIQRVLRLKNSLMLFGEGYTDDEFIRSLKPMKKGAARIGFNTMEGSNWQEDIKVQPLGLNYTDPSAFRSDILISYGKIMRLKDYQAVFEENPNKAITQLTKDIGEEICNNLTYVKDRSKAPFHEHLMMLTRKGMNHENHAPDLSIEERFAYSQQLANRMNEEFTEEAEDWKELETLTENYFDQLKKNKVKEKEVYRFVKNGNKKSIWPSWLYLILSFPLFLASCLHNLLPYLIVKTFTEKMFKRKVFWSGVKLMLGGLVWLLYNLPVFWLFPALIYDSFWLSFLYFFTVPTITFLFFHHWITMVKETISYQQKDEQKLKKFSQERVLVLQKIEAMEV